MKPLTGMRVIVNPDQDYLDHSSSEWKKNCVGRTGTITHVGYNYSSNPILWIVEVEWDSDWDGGSIWTYGMVVKPIDGTDLDWRLR